MASVTETGIAKINPAAVPPLCAGDHFSAPEFERRYHAMPHLKKAELIEGVVFLPAPFRHEDHSGPHADWMCWMGTYRAFTPGTDCGDNATVRLDLDNLPQPDGLLRILPEFGGNSRTLDGYIVGAPELVAEIAASTASYDLHEKMNAFRRNGVQEYVVWRVWERAIDWFQLEQGNYERMPLAAGSRYESRVLPGLWLEVEAMLSRDMAQVLGTAQQGLASPEHAAFVARLKQQQAVSSRA